MKNVHEEAIPRATGSEDLESDMLEPWEAMERFAARSTDVAAESATSRHAERDTPGVNVTRTFHADCGHGWLAVPHADLDTLGISELRVDSHFDDCFVYLEEDEDTGIYLRAAEQAGWTVDMKTEQIWADSFIRYLPGREA